MILLIDNYDSFSYNVFQLVGSVNPDIRVIRNDECSVDEIRAMNPSHIILSPGPGRPDKAGVCENVIRELGGQDPYFGNLSRTSGNLRSGGGYRYLRIPPDAWKTVPGNIRYRQRVVPGNEKGHHCGKISFPGSGSADDSRRIESYRSYRRWRSHGGRTDGKTDLRSTIPSGIRTDTGRTTDYR